MRKSIFDIASENISMFNETQRLLKMFLEEDMLCTSDSNGDITLCDFVDEYCFNEWSSRNHFVDLYDYLETLRFDALKIDAAYNADGLIMLVELIYNMWNISYKRVIDEDPCDGIYVNAVGNFYHLQNVMDDILQQYNHKVFYFGNNNDSVLVVEDKENVSAAVEILPKDLALDIIKYNHQSLKGDITTKRKILQLLANQLEPRRKELNKIDRDLEDMVFYLLNNVHIRHNNKDASDKNYKKYVSNLTDEELEQIYDELYQMLLLAFLQLDNVSRLKQMKELKKEIEDNNG